MDEDTGESDHQVASREAAAIVAHEGEVCPCGDPFHVGAIGCRRCLMLRPSVFTPEKFLWQRARERGEL